MRITIEFNLPDEKHDFNNAIKANNMMSILHDIDNFCRGKIKHGDNEAVASACEEIRALIEVDLYEE